VLYFRVFSAPTKKQLLERRGGGKGQKQPSTPVGLQAATSTAMPPSTLFVQSVQCEVTLARAGVISNAVLKIIAPKLPSKSALFFISCSLFLPDSTGLMTQIIRTAFETVSQGFRVYWMPKQLFLTIGPWFYGRRKQLFMMIRPVKGQLQASIGATWQPEVTVCPLLSTAVQLVQWEVTLALAGAMSNTTLSIRETRLTSKSIFFFTSKFSLSARDTGR